MKLGVKEMKREYKKVNIDQIEVGNCLTNSLYHFTINSLSCHFRIYKMILKICLNRPMKFKRYLEGVMVALMLMRMSWKLVIFHLKIFIKNFLIIFYDHSTELDALADELAADTDTSYLDEVTAPKVPTKEPGAESVNSVINIIINEAFYI